MARKGAYKMDLTQAGNALKQPARKKGISVDTVRYEIEIAINSGFNSTAPQAQAFWNSIPRKGERPTPEEVIVHIAKMIKNQRMHTSGDIGPISPFFGGTN